MVSWIYLDVNKCQHVWERHDKLCFCLVLHILLDELVIFYTEKVPLLFNMQYTNKHMH